MNPSLPSDPHAITLHLGLFFDGTGLNLHNHEQGVTSGNTSGSYASGKSNVARLFQLYPQQAQQCLDPGSTRAAMALYIEGVGTRDGGADSLLSQATGRYGSGVWARLEALPDCLASRMREFLEHHPHVVIRSVEIDLFGFSRGAAAARHVANQLDDAASDLRQVLGGYPVRIRFVGLFDTVAAIIAPLKANFSAGNDDYHGLQLGLRPGVAAEIVHLVAADEWRANFPLVASEDDIFLPGSHTDLGGGYRPEETEQLLLARPWSSLEPYHLPVEKSQAWRQASEHLEQCRATWQALNFDVRLDSHSIDQPFLPKTDIQREKRVHVRIFGERWVHGELSRVYLAIMHERAIQAGVPLRALDPDDAQIPEALQGIASKLRAYGLGVQAAHDLDESEYALLRRHYIHLSAHWQISLNGHNPLFDGLHVNRPALNEKRVVHANPWCPERLTGR
ncbi:T6SS phospholipase effector Tle1-like catalytic domain-containing protein [Pseudomonas huaxiensis]|uniref:T6SS phospholipase effector Tle1-like catalytic domain-containing protein n=1 Tax=Pseudomonas huaxiensis TaxID=2213017 RepID=UPI0015AADD1C|nr:DUF2235 domain-containing protein [Pseudomonas huaxiensis]